MWLKIHKYMSPQAYMIISHETASKEYKTQMWHTYFTIHVCSNIVSENNHKHHQKP